MPKTYPSKDRPRSDRRLDECHAERLRTVWRSRPGAAECLHDDLADGDRPTNQALYYDSVYTAQIFWVKLGGISFEPGAGVRRLQVVGQFELMGDVSNQFQPATMFPFVPPTK